MSAYEAVIKVNLGDESCKRARDIADGIAYACAVLMDEYGYTADAIRDIAERVQDEASDRAASAGLADDGAPL